MDTSQLSKAIQGQSDIRRKVIEKNARKRKGDRFHIEERISTAKKGRRKDRGEGKGGRKIAWRGHIPKKGTQEAQGGKRRGFVLRTKN